MSIRIYYGILGMILLMGAVLRIAPVWTNPEKNLGGLGVFGDTIAFMSTAENLVKGAGFSIAPDGGVPSILRPPLYPAFLAICLWARGWSPDSCRVAQGVLDVASVFLLFLSARILCGERWKNAAGLLAAALGATCPYLIFFSRQLLSETLTAFFMSLALYLHLKIHRSGRLSLWGLAGASIALAGLTRPDAGWMVLPLILTHSILLRRDKKKVLRPVLCMVLGFALCLVPWTLRNFLVFGRVISFAGGNLGLNLYMGTWEKSSLWMEKGWEFPPDSGPPGEREEVERKVLMLHRSHAMTGGREMFDMDEWLFAIAVKRILQDPWSYAKLCVLRLPRLWWIDPHEKYQIPEPGALPVLVYFILAVLGSVWLCRPSGGLILVPWTVIAYVTLAHIPMHVEARFSLQSMPALLVLASGAACLASFKSLRYESLSAVG